MISSLPEELVHEVAAFLTPLELHRIFILSSNDLRQSFAESYVTWRQVLGTTPHDVIFPLLREYNHGQSLLRDYNNPKCNSYAKMARDIAGIEKLSMVHWREAHFDDDTDLFSEQEAHSSVLLTFPSLQKYMAVVPGWGRAVEDVEVFDVSDLPNVQRANCKIVGGIDYFKYGHSSTKLNDNVIFVFGGLSMGGYRGAINNLSVLKIRYNADDIVDSEPTTYDSNKDEKCYKYRDIEVETSTMHTESAGSHIIQNGEDTKELRCMVESCNTDSVEGSRMFDSFIDTEPIYTRNSNENSAGSTVEVEISRVSFPADIVPTPRGYHSATIVNICSINYLIVWGGLGNVPTSDIQNIDDDVSVEESKTLTKLECMNCTTLMWNVDLISAGLEPSPRFGHSCTFHPRTNSLIIVGGSNGTDLLRNGDELREVHMLTFVPPHCDENAYNNDSTCCINVTSLVWSQICVNPSAAMTEVPGRCHSAILACKNKLLIFGGSAKSTNRVVVMDLSNLTADGYRHDCSCAEEKQHIDDKKLNLDRISTVDLISPMTCGIEPSGRLSALCVQVGKFILIQGGYDLQRGCLSDCLVWSDVWKMGLSAIILFWSFITHRYWTYHIAPLPTDQKYMRWLVSKKTQNWVRRGCLDMRVQIVY